jgi:hypothetical protein
MKGREGMEGRGDDGWTSNMRGGRKETEDTEGSMVCRMMGKREEKEWEGKLSSNGRMVSRKRKGTKLARKKMKRRRI